MRYVKQMSIFAKQPVRVADVTRLSRIEAVNFNGAGVDDETMQWISHLPHLRLFQITPTGDDPCQATDRGFALLAKCPELFGIDCSQPVQFGEQALRPLAVLLDLWMLEFSDMQITPEMLRAISRLSYLERLDLYNCTFVDSSSLVELAALPKLKLLDLKGTNLTNAALASLANCPALTELNIGDCKQLTDEGVLKLLEFPKLKRLFLTGKPQFSAETLQRLQQQISDVQIYN